MLLSPTRVCKSKHDAGLRGRPQSQGITFRRTIVQRAAHRDTTYGDATYGDTMLPSQVMHDGNEDMFYMYYIGQYNNELIYHYGVSNDLSIVEMRMLHNRVHPWILIRYDVLEHHVYTKDRFKAALEDLGLQRDVVMPDTFALASDYNTFYIADILDRLLCKPR